MPSLSVSVGRLLEEPAPQCGVGGGVVLGGVVALLVAVLVGHQDDLGAVVVVALEHVGLLDADHDVVLVADKVLHGDALGEGLGDGEAGAVHPAGVLKVGGRDVGVAAAGVGVPLAAGDLEA